MMIVLHSPASNPFHAAKPMVDNRHFPDNTPALGQLPQLANRVIDPDQFAGFFSPTGRL
jgi:hypothetical protein